MNAARTGRAVTAEEPYRPNGQRDQMPGPEIGDRGAAGNQSRGGPAWHRAVVLGVVGWNLWQLRATVLAVQYRNDSTMHELMVRFATARLRAGHDPLGGWFPYLGLGSPQFLHYQSAPAILTGLAGLTVGPDAAFRWSLYLLWCLWPVAIYCSARVFGLDRWPAAFAAMVAPLVSSVPGIGYEMHAYAWSGYGVWTQLWGSWALPLAWALSWRAMADRRFVGPAAALVALTAAFHYETGYLAFLAILIMPFLVGAGIRARLARAALLLAAALIASAWVVVPLLRYSRWAGINQALATTPLAKGYGAQLTLGWLATGKVLDYGHWPVVSLLAAAGLVITLARWRRQDTGWAARTGRALVALFCAALVLSFGRTTFGGLADLVPGGPDLFFRRFLMGAELAAIYLAGLGAAALAGQGAGLVARCASVLAGRRAGLADASRLTWLPITVLAAAWLAYLSPAWHWIDSAAAANSAAIGYQRLAQAQQPQAAAAAQVAAFLLRRGGGRTYAGSPANAEQYPAVGLVPMYAYLASKDIDEVGYTLRTASLMSQPEYYFDPADAGDYALLGVRYVVLSAQQPSPRPPRGAVPVLRNSLYQVFELPGNSYFQVVDTVGTITANRADIGSQTLSFMRSSLPGQGRDLTVGYAGARAAPPTLPGPAAAHGPARARGPAGTVLAEHADLAAGTASAVVRLSRPAVVVLSASFDPGWTVTVDGRPAATQMVAPALVAVAAPAGVHLIMFRYQGFGGYPALLAVAMLDIVVVTVFTAFGLPYRRRWPRGSAIMMRSVIGES